MYLSARSSSLPRRRWARPFTTLAALLLPLASAVALAGPSAAARPASVPAAPGVSLRSLAMTGTTTTVTVHRVYRRGQVQWINHVLNTRLAGLDGCQAQRTRATWDGFTYRSTVRTVCSDGPARAEAAARRLKADRPWYGMHVSRASLVGFGLLADLPAGSDRAVPAALALLPSGPFTFAEGDDLSLSYVGQGVTQRQLDGAVAAFARALRVPVGKVEVTPLAG